jgi:hypothetical protein
LNASNFADLRDKKTATVRNEQKRLISEMKRLHREIDEAFRKQLGLPGRRARKEDLLRAAGALVEQAPSLESQAEEEAAQRLNEEQKALSHAIATQAGFKDQLLRIADVQQRIKTFQAEINRFSAALLVDLREIGVPDTELNRFVPFFPGDVETPLIQRLDNFKSRIAELEGDEVGPLPWTIRAYRIRVKQLSDAIMADEAKRKRFIEIQAALANTDQELHRIDAEISSIEGPEAEKLNAMREQRRAIYVEYFETLKLEQQALAELYKPLQDQFVTHEEEKKVKFHIRWLIDIDAWLAKGMHLFDQRKSLPYLFIGERFATFPRLHLTGHVHSDFREWVLTDTLVLASPPENAPRRRKPNLTNGERRPIGRNQAMNPSACCVLCDTFGSHVRKLTLHFKEHGPPAGYRLIGWLGCLDECLEQFPATDASAPRGTIGEQWETVRCVITGVVAIGTPLQHRRGQQKVVADSIDKERIGGGVQSLTLAGKKGRHTRQLGNLRPHYFPNLGLFLPFPVRIGLRVLLIAIRCLGTNHVPNEVVTHGLPALGWTRIILMLPNEPCVPTAGERDCVALGERLAFTFPLSAQDRYASFNLGNPLRVACLCFRSRSIGGLSQLSFPMLAVEARIGVTHIDRNDLSREELTVRQTI